MKTIASCSPRAMRRHCSTPRWRRRACFRFSRLMTLRQFASELEGHPTPRIYGVDAATRSLGQGLSVGAGLAIGARMDKSSTRVYVLTGDGELAEGQVWEAAAFAAHNDLDNLTVIADINRLGQSEPTMYQHDMERYRLKFESEGFETQVIDGHDVAAVLAALDHAKAVKGRHRPFWRARSKATGSAWSRTN
jgi:transketolase